MMVVHLDRLAPYFLLLEKMTLRREQCKTATAPTSVATREAFDVKAAGCHNFLVREIEHARNAMSSM